MLEYKSILKVGQRDLKGLDEGCWEKGTQRGLMIFSLSNEKVDLPLIDMRKVSCLASWPGGGGVQEFRLRHTEFKMTIRQSTIDFLLTKSKFIILKE